MTSPIDQLIATITFRCTLCNAKMGGCDCWIKCDCGWHYEKGTECNNPKCAAKELHGAAEDEA